MAVTSAAPILENAANFLGHSAQAAKRVPLSAIAGGLVGAGTYVHRRKEGDTQVEAMLSGITTGAAVAGLTHLFTEKTGVFSRWGERAATAERTAVENTTSEQVARARGMAEDEASRGAESQLQKDAIARGQSAPVDEDIPHYDVEAEQAEQARRAKEAEASATSEPVAQVAGTNVSQEVSAPSSPVQEVTPTATQAEPVAQAVEESAAASTTPTVEAPQEPVVIPASTPVQDPSPRKTEEQMLNERVATMAQGRKSLPLSTVEPATANPTPAAQPTSTPVGFKSSIPGLQEAVEEGLWLRDQYPVGVGDGWVKDSYGTWYRSQGTMFSIYDPGRGRTNLSTRMPEEPQSAMQRLSEYERSLSTVESRLSRSLDTADYLQDPTTSIGRIRQHISQGALSPDEAEEFYRRSTEVGARFLSGPGANYERIKPDVGAVFDPGLHMDDTIPGVRNITRDPQQHNTVSDVLAIGWRNKQTGEVLRKASITRRSYVPNVTDL